MFPFIVCIRFVENVTAIQYCPGDATYEAVAADGIAPKPTFPLSKTLWLPAGVFPLSGYMDILIVPEPALTGM